jgi:hypothetical protein
MDIYANTFYTGYGYTGTGAKSDYYYISEKLSPLGSTYTNTTNFASTASGTYTTISGQRYYPNWSASIGGLNVNLNNFTAVWSGLYKATTTGNVAVAISTVDDTASVYWGHAYAYDCKTGLPTASTAGRNLAGAGSFTKAVVAGQYYPIRVVFGKASGTTAKLTLTVAGQATSSTNSIYPPECAMPA